MGNAQNSNRTSGGGDAGGGGGTKSAIYNSGRAERQKAEKRRATATTAFGHRERLAAAAAAVVLCLESHFSVVIDPPNVRIVYGLERLLPAFDLCPLATGGCQGITTTTTKSMERRRWSSSGGGIASRKWRRREQRDMDGTPEGKRQICLINPLPSPPDRTRLLTIGQKRMAMK
uniref:Uncharacterized protein n=1 Tax=Globodera rostochiensis TaxID=31243 RepID=A0A914I9W0_GLORO